MTAPAVTWYKPEFPDDAARHSCYCNAQALGRTAYWNGYQLSFRWHCRKHLPVEGAVHQAVSS